MRGLASLCSIAIFAMLLLWSCGGTDTKKGEINGVILLDGAQDNSGITVVLYAGTLFPEQAMETLQQNPQLAYPVTDEILFDHRAYPPLKTTQTSFTGSFTFDDIEYGVYNVAYYKQGWGWSCVTDLELNSAQLSINQASTRDEQRLYPEIDLVPVIAGTYTLLSGRCYRLAQNAICTEGSNLVFQPGVKLMLDQNVKLTIYGSVTFPMDGPFVQITSSSQVYTGQGSVLLGGGIEIVSANALVQRVILSHLSNGISIRGDNVTISHASINRCQVGITSYQVSDLSIMNSIVAYNDFENAAGVYNNTAANITLSDNLFLGNYIAAQNDVVVNGVVSNNVFIDNARAYLNLWESTAVFSHNKIVSQGIGVENSGKSNLDIQYNDFDTKVCVKTYHTNNWFNSAGVGWTKASYNNLIGSQYAVESRAMYYYAGEAFPLDFKQNYWGTTASNEIQSIIIDTNDLGAHGGSWVWSVIEYSPLRSSAVADAGIQ